MPRKKTSSVAIVIPYKPRYPQTLIHPQLESHRFCVLVTHRQMGKTVCAINHLLKSALQNPLPSGRYFYISPFMSFCTVCHPCQVSGGHSSIGNQRVGPEWNL